MESCIDILFVLTVHLKAKHDGRFSERFVKKFRYSL